MILSTSGWPKKLLLCIFTLFCLCGFLWYKEHEKSEHMYMKLESSTISPETTLAQTIPPTVTAKETNLPVCPEKSPHLAGMVRENLKSVTLDQVETSLTSPVSDAFESYYSDMEPAGHYFPRECIARQKLAILIPFRNRHEHLAILLNNLVPVLRRQQMDFRIYVIEQEPGVTFNKGLLFNVGFITALSRHRFDCVVLHDVDCLPLNDIIFYRCEDNPRHLMVSGSKWNYSLPYHEYLGGAVVMSQNQYLNINGYSNLYFGWGSEDDDMWLRILHRGYRILRYPKSIARYYQLQHARDRGNTENSARFSLVRRATARVMTDGLRSAVYKIKSIEEKPLFVWIRVSVNMTKVLQTAPKDAIAVLKVLLDKSKRFDKMGLGHSEEGDKFELPS